MPENLEKCRSTELYDAPLEGWTIFLYRSSTSGSPLDSSGLPELKYAFSAGQDVTLKNYNVGTDVKTLDQVLVPALRRSYQNRCEELFFSEVFLTLAKFGLPFDKATQLIHFPKALKRPRNNAGPASIY